MNSNTLALVALLSCIANFLIGADLRPNVLVILADDLGYADLGVQGCKDIPTPNIDSIATNGIRCTSGYVSSCMCSPSRAGLMTGRSQSRFGHEINWEGNDPSGEKGLPVSEKTFAQLMKGGGYRTGIVGKWHLGNEDRFHPLARGFDEFFGFLSGSHDYLSDWRENNLLQRNREQAGPIRKKPDDSQYLTTMLSKEASAFIHRNRESPWLLYLPFNAPHTPHQATKELLARFAPIADENRRVYAAMVSGLDDAVGIVLDQLRKDGLADNTLIMFLSDNGGPLDRNGSLNTPLSGEKGTMFEGGIRIPFFVQWKARLEAGKTYDRPVSSLDLLPTALGAAKVEPPKRIAFDGVNLLPFLTGEIKSDPHVALYWRMKPRDLWAVRAGDDKLIMQHRGGPQHPVGKSPRLIQLGADLQELNDISSSNSRRALELRSMYDAWNGTLMEPLWGIQESEK